MNFRGLTPYECKNCPFKTSDNWALAKHKKTCSAAEGMRQADSLQQSDNMAQERYFLEAQLF